MNPQCVQMHKAGYCLCVTVECVWCQRCHPPEHACEGQEIVNALNAVFAFLLWCNR